jgi:hypothetical protein
MKNCVFRLIMLQKNCKNDIFSCKQQVVKNNFIFNEYMNTGTQDDKFSHAIV